MTRVRLLAAAAALLVGSAAGCGGDDRQQGAEAKAETHGHTVELHPVAGNFKPDGTKLADCEPGDHRCYEQAFGNVAFKQGPKTALRLFDEKIATDSAVESGCHRIAHMIGSAALARYDGNAAKAFAEGSSSCWSGYYHGILERALTGVTSKEELAKVSRDLCDDAEIRRTTFIAYQCVHGLGHGLMIHTGYDLPFSLSICDRLATSWDQTSCTGGVFMENISSSYGVRSKWLRDDDPVYPCGVVKERHKLYCYLMVTSRINETNGFDWAKTAETCRRVEAGWIETCFESYGRDASGSTRQSPPEVARICALAKDYASACYYGAARDMTSNYANGRRAAELCALAPAPMRSRCFHGIGTILGTIHPDSAGRRAACGELSRRYARDCLRGTGENA